MIARLLDPVLRYCCADIVNNALLPIAFVESAVRHLGDQLRNLHRFVIEGNADPQSSAGNKVDGRSGI
ncbi:hypothetical protein D3C77_589690 [compost metagenome]